MVWSFQACGRWALLALLAAPGLGCRQGPAAAEEPVWGKQPCDHCAMLLSERLHGAQVATVQGDRLFFDDVGCMVAWDAEHPGKAEARWVRRFDQPPRGTGWLRAETAAYERAAHTPMDFGFVAVANPGAAGAGTPVVAWPEVVAAVKSKLGGR